MLAVVGDIGGTNIRLAVCNIKNGELSQLREYSCAQFITLDAVLVQYFSTLRDTVKYLCLGIACPVEDDAVIMTNFSWQFSKKALKEKLQLNALYLINDYTAISLAVPFLKENEQLQIGGGAIKEGAPKAVFGPGTGLGVAHLIQIKNKWLSLKGEGGHASLSVNNREQADILLLLQDQYGHVSTERVLSGQGFVNIYHSLCRLSGKSPEFYEPQQVTTAAFSQKCPLALHSIEVFCQIMGAFAGDLALNLACFGGVYIAGGIVPRFSEFFIKSDFRQCFENKGRFKPYLRAIPTFLIIHENPGLLGASVYLRQETLE
ncbi:glucokinase [Psychromonas sp. CD1]|uniref:Glucokinase n=1 Tax=Hirondellea gigas TaxID=1518452 RepID=A0A6A7G6L5_9CRUS|nr:glucokinase [Psychromonas sp. CD1]